ncbi:hypothetical protein [Micromonospora sp. 067-2]|uniref:hypothetical protein n=1 Tax=Micromonospora sp. 067-2 TaxID=2789270 RepID=UPI003979B17F
MVVAFGVVDGNRLTGLDERIIAAGVQRRCACGATAPADERWPVTTVVAWAVA